MKNKKQKLVDHILIMADDAYFCDHPEWYELVNEAKKIKKKSGKLHFIENKTTTPGNIIFHDKNK